MMKNTDVIVKSEKRSKEKNVRFQLEIKQSMLDEITTLVELGGFSSKKEFMNNAISLLRWAMLQRKAGNIIAAIDDQERIRELEMPCLTNIAVQIQQSGQWNTEPVSEVQDRSTKVKVIGLV